METNALTHISAPSARGLSAEIGNGCHGCHATAYTQILPHKRASQNDVMTTVTTELYI